MASVFQSYRLYIDKASVPLSVDTVKDLEAFGNAFVLLDGDLAVIITEHKEDVVFTTVGIELEANPGTFANLVHEHFSLPETVTGRLVVEPIME
jgi:hypothetical protein